MPTAPLPRTRSEIVWSRTFVAGLAAYLILHCWIVSGRKPLWMDELMSFTLVTDPSLPHALAALGHGADGGFPSYYCAAWPVAHWLGSAEFTVRMVSSAFVAAAFGLLFGLLRRTYGLRPAMFATVLSVGGSTLILYQNSEVRFYADLLFATALAVSGFERIHRAAQQGLPPRWPLAVNALGHAWLVLTHPFGVVFSAAISVAALVTFWWQRPRNFFGPYLISAAAGCAFFGLWIQGFLRQARLLQGHGTLPVPTVPDLFRIYAQLAPSFYYDDSTKAWAAHRLLPVREHLWALGFVGAVALVFLTTVALIGRRLAARPPAPVTGEPAAPADGHLLILAAALILVPGGIWITSHLGKSLFIHRYFISSVLGFAVLYAHLFARFGRWAATRGAWSTLAGRATRGLGAALFVGLYVAWPLAAAIHTPDGHAPLRARTAGEAQGMPIVPFPTNTFWQESHYALDNQYWFILDREAADDPANSTFAVSEYVFSHVLREYYPQLHIVPTAEFLRRNPEFIVAAPDVDPWYRLRLRNNPAYTAEPAPGLPPGALRLVRHGLP